MWNSEKSEICNDDTNDGNDGTNDGNDDGNDGDE